MNIKKLAGFTFIEVVIVIAIFVVIFTVIASFGENTSLLSNLINKSLQAEQDLRQTFQVIVTEIRSAGPSSLGAYPIESAATSSFAFFSDIDEDGVFERVRYFVGTSTLEKGVIEPIGNPLVYATSSESVKIAVNYLLMASSTFEYYDANYTGLEASLSTPIDVTKIRIVKVTVTADVNPGAAPKPVTFTNIINVRNLRSN
ncbi:MAG: prepilin-type N-terminal cleavage/methylation domain-containing protein [Candidatus Liptonbacteria bacterium]|nr:prepilin-type N-terminal cleavage/methylation domain-containing protein [Candidatus Liptonbacteria bacterium]